MSLFFNSLVTELNHLYEICFTLNAQKFIVALTNNLLDIPAKAWHLNHMGHTGTFGCCKIKGSDCITSQKKIFLPVLNRVYKSRAMHRNFDNKLRLANVN